MSKEFNCKGKRLADYLVKHGSKLIRNGHIQGINVYVFEYDESIDKNIERFEMAKKRCLF